MRRNCRRINAVSRRRAAKPAVLLGELALDFASRSSDEARAE
jgi:hypothetical protein